MQDRRDGGHMGRFFAADSPWQSSSEVCSYDSSSVTRACTRVVCTARGGLLATLLQQRIEGACAARPLGDAKEALHVPCGVVEEVSGDTGEMTAG